MSGFKAMFMLTLGLVTRKEVLGYGVSLLSLLLIFPFTAGPGIVGVGEEREGEVPLTSTSPPVAEVGHTHSWVGR